MTKKRRKVKKPKTEPLLVADQELLTFAHETWYGKWQTPCGHRNGCELCECRDTVNIMVWGSSLR